MKKIIIVIGVVILGLVIYYSARHPEGTEGSKALDSSQAQNDTVMTPEEKADAEATKASIQSNPAPARYVNSKYSFSFNKPEGYTVGILPGDNGGETLIVQSNNGDVKSAFQIVITPLDEPMKLSPNLIKSEIPGTSIVNPFEIKIDNVGNGIMFESNNDAFAGKSYEVWFNTSDKLFQITSYKEFGAELQKIIGTWKFN
jgi:hypothetical protein